MSFISPEELFKHIREENAQAIKRDDEDKAPGAINAAVEEAESYMSRYDYVTIFGMTGEDRNPILVMYIKEMAKWYFISICNAGVDYESAEKRYDQAVAWFNKLQKGWVVMRDWPLYNEQDGLGNSYSIASNEKRGQHY